MSLAKRLEEAAREGRVTEQQADEVLNRRVELWAGREAGGQMLMFYDNGKYQQEKGSQDGRNSEDGF